MSAPIARRGNLFVVSFLLLLCILAEQLWIARFCPLLDAAGSIRPMIVFLDIPLPLPKVDWFPVSILFAILYPIVIAPGLSRSGQRDKLSTRIWKALAGFWLLFGCTAAGGGVYYLIQDYLPKQVANGIDSFGIRADITLPYPFGDLVHLHGSVIGLGFTLLGLHWMSRLTATPLQSPAVAEAQAIIDTPPPKTPTTKIIKASRREPARADERANKKEAVLVDQPAQAMPQPPKPTASPATTAATSRRSAVSVTQPPAALPQYPAYPGEPPACRLTTPPPIAVVMPRRAPAIGRTYPCFIIGSLKPNRHHGA